MKKATLYHFTFVGIALAVTVFSGCHYDLDQNVDFEILPTPIEIDASVLTDLPDGGYAFELEQNCEFPEQIRMVINELDAFIKEQEIDLSSVPLLSVLKPRFELRSFSLKNIVLTASEGTFSGLSSLSLEMKDSKSNKKIVFSSTGNLKSKEISLTPKGETDIYGFFKSPDLECLDLSLIIDGKAPEKPVTFNARVFANLKIRVHFI
ncbi:MAG: hypothetical protein GX130_07875 [Candidatus Hydrogenedens sp.]|nr:hypothetical protein [Candidatus Hydrogenedens sp.]